MINFELVINNTSAATAITELRILEIHSQNKIASKFASDNLIVNINYENLRVIITYRIGD